MGLQWLVPSDHEAIMTRQPERQPGSDGLAEDFRVRAARQKRERMRARLLEATLDVYEPWGRGRAAVIDDVVRRADVSRGTFYKYFETLEEAVAELGRQLAEETLGNYRDLFSQESDPATRTAGGPVLTLARAAMEPRWGLFTASIDFIEQFSHLDSLYAIVADPLEDARRQGIVRFDSMDAAMDMVVGTTTQAIKRLAHGQQRNRQYILDIAALCLTGLGTSRDQSAAAAERAWSRLSARGSTLPWWQEL
jgi:AcrR family transcriptional regulator